jgi:hypothetical protein
LINVKNFLEYKGLLEEFYDFVAKADREEYEDLFETL